MNLCAEGENIKAMAFGKMTRAAGHYFVSWRAKQHAPIQCMIRK